MKIAGLMAFVLAALLGAMTAAAAPADFSALAAPKIGLIQSAPHVYALKAETRMADLQALADTDFVLASNGKQVPVSLLHTLQAIHNLDSQPRPQPTLMMHKVDVNAVPKLTLSKSQTDFGALLQLPKETVLSTPGGRRFTVEQLRLLQPQIEVHIGRPLASVHPYLTPDGPVQMIAHGTKPDALLKLPDNTVLQSPSGKRISVGELRQYLHDHPHSGAATPKPRHAQLDSLLPIAAALTPPHHSNRQMQQDRAADMLLGALGIGDAQASTQGIVDDALSLIANVLSLVPPGAPSPIPITSSDVTAVQGILDSCFGAGKSLQACIDQVTDHQFTSDIGLLFKIIKDFGPPVSYGDLLLDAGEAFICLGAQLIFDFDVCALLKDLIEVAEGVYDAAKAVVEFVEDVGCAIVGCDNDTPELTDAQIEQQYFAPSVPAAVTVLETCIDEPCKASHDWFSNFSNPYWHETYGDNAAYQMFMDQVIGSWTVDLLGKLLSPANGAPGKLQSARDSYWKHIQAEIPLNISAAENDRNNCLGWLSSAANGLVSNYDYWFYYGHSNDQATVDKQRTQTPDGKTALPESNEHWCANTLGPEVHQLIQTAVPHHYQDIGCPANASTHLCTTPDAETQCLAFTQSLPSDVAGVAIGPVCTLDPAWVAGDLAKNGCTASGTQFVCASPAAFQYCQTDTKKYGLPQGTQCFVAPDVAANATLAQLNASKPGSCSRSGTNPITITCARDRKAIACQGLIFDAGPAVACVLNRPLDAAYNNKYNAVSNVLAGNSANSGGAAHGMQASSAVPKMALEPDPATAKLSAFVPERKLWARVSDDPLKVWVPSGIKGTPSAGQAAPPQVLALQKTLDQLAAQLMPGASAPCLSPNHVTADDPEDDGVENLELCATYNFDGKPETGVPPTVKDGGKLGYANPSMPASRDGEFRNAANLGNQAVINPAAGSTAAMLQQQMQNTQSANTGVLQMQQTSRATAAQALTTDKAASPQTGSLATPAGAALAAGGAAAAGFNQQQSQTLSATLPKGPAPPAPSSSPASHAAAIRLDSVTAQVLAAGAPAGRVLVANAEAAGVACPVELTISAAALIDQAGPLSFESYLLAPDGSRQTWVHGVPLVAQAPLPYRAPTHGSLLLQSGSFDQMLTLAINIGMNGQTTHLETSQHFKVSCRGTKTMSR